MVQGGEPGAWAGTTEKGTSCLSELHAPPVAHPDAGLSRSSGLSGFQRHLWLPSGAVANTIIIAAPEERTQMGFTNPSPGHMSPPPRGGLQELRMLFLEEEKPRRVHYTFPGHLKGNAGKRDLFSLRRDKTRNKGRSYRGRLGAEYEELSKARALWRRNGL